MFWGGPRGKYLPFGKISGAKCLTRCSKVNSGLDLRVLRCCAKMARKPSRVQRYVPVSSDSLDAVGGLEEKLTAPRASWKNPYAERLIGTVRRECLDRVIILGEQHPQGVLADYFDDYHRSRPHRSLSHNCPSPRPKMTLEQGVVVEFPQVGGLPHLYPRRAA